MRLKRDRITFDFYTGLPHCMRTPILSPFPHFFHPSPPSLFISTITFTSPPPSLSSSPHIPHLPHLPPPLPPSPPSPPHPSLPSQSGVTKEHAAADGQRGHTSTRLVPSPWLREEPGQTAAGETAVHSEKGKTNPHSQVSSRAFIILRAWYITSHVRIVLLCYRL